MISTDFQDALGCVWAGGPIPRDIVGALCEAIQARRVRKLVVDVAETFRGQQNGRVEEEPRPQPALQSALAGELRDLFAT